ncbi:hypothetical protein GLOIN_2v1791596 [Rhizophagus irregularis DAOM 181602=DAOM 197198]|uniref:Uncharacterized protein n=1 Tax=Rhizophagus irregularis (strain DAOM 181602 / DAOM 197198 / MUCL 43194) TaxID=747089 RepID=A0A2P4NWS4_RHIID|nr:hypothetical protein GLOIN_2v1791596 [Rhizophagus irregularis DAOM 181602=DAOM 197198]POG57601.1 hypothetical protein GLOIN_2v1791596 [Rhizophagus irregularis DAOM 181602=DAOM 197198]|eukprot:XP_025164467.1 hypothetical protein GLOIN_2v1791596 [Rhizophagus irregularis DAOM 181602=DAOM 197198]
MTFHKPDTSISSKSKYRNENLEFISIMGCRDFDISDLECRDNIKSYSIENNIWGNKIFGISQNQETNYYIFVLRVEYCIKCNQQYASIYYKGCSTQYSKNATIDNIIQMNLDEKVALKFIYGSSQNIINEFNEL